MLWAVVSVGNVFFGGVVRGGRRGDFVRAAAPGTTCIAYSYCMLQGYSNIRGTGQQFAAAQTVSMA